MFGTYQRLGLPVTASDIEVIRAVRAKLRPETRTPHRYRSGRHAIYRVTLDYHHRAAALYTNAMRGNL